MVDRSITLGYCGAPAIPEVASICVHKGEEPVICGEKGICNVFFAYCNLQCIFCQNHQISGRKVDPEAVFYHGMESIVNRILEVLKDTENVVGFVSPSHYVHLIPMIVDALHDKGVFPTVVYNTNGYDSVEALQGLMPYVDVYLPDFKYSQEDLALKYSHAEDYPQVAKKALAEMFSQKGSSLPIDENGLAFRGIIIRHLILPGRVDNSLAALDWIADNLSTNLHISLMSQYFPPEGLELPDELNRTITLEEYDRVVDHFYELGFHKGWVQELEASENYRPDFYKKQAF